MTFYRAADAELLGDDTMSPPTIDPSVFEELDLSPIGGGSVVDVLFKGDGFTLIRGRFKPGYRLPRHSHSADCLYYVVSGQAIMGSRVIKAGDGFFVKADAPYAYQAGPDGAEVLEFRAATSFDMRIFDQTADAWRPVVAAAVANQARWAEMGGD
jgi:quercetin dioxygenase-like cupin family protein